MLVCIAGDPGVRLREIGDRVGITEPAAHRIVVELAEAGYITRAAPGRPCTPRTATSRRPGSVTSDDVGPFPRGDPTCILDVDLAGDDLVARL